MTSITRTGKRVAASAMTARDTLATTTAPGARSAAISAGNAVAQPMRLPLQREVARREFGFGDRFMVLAAGLGGPGDDAADETKPRIAGQRAARRVQQRVLARAARPHHQHQHGFPPGRLSLRGPPGRSNLRREIAGPPGLAMTEGSATPCSPPVRRSPARSAWSPARTGWPASVGMAVLERGGNAFDAAVRHGFHLAGGRAAPERPGRRRADHPARRAQTGTQHVDLRPGRRAAAPPRWKISVDSTST